MKEKTYQEKLLNAAEKIGEQLMGAFDSEGHVNKGEVAKAVSDMTLLTVIANTTHKDWKNAKPQLVEVKMPEKCSEVLKVCSDTWGMSLAELESSFINLVLEIGLPHLAMHVYKKYNIL